MSKKTVLIAATAAVLLSFAATAPTFAQSIPAEEIEQLSNASAPDVDAGASKGMDNPIVVQERMQLGNSAGPNVSSRSEKGGPSIPELEKAQIE